MNDREFVDANVLIHAFDRSAKEKRDLAAALVERLWSERRRNQVAFWDAVILRSAMRLSCQVVWSEDFVNKQRWDFVVVRNPFRGSEPASGR